MASFVYKVKDERGKSYCAVADAQDVQSLKQSLRERGWYVTKVAAVHDAKKVFLFRRRVSLDSLIMFTHELASMLESGIPMLSGLEILWRQMDDPWFQLVISQLKNKLAQGASISEVFNEFPEVFPPLYRALMGVADIGANLIKIMRKLLQYLHHQKEFITKLRRATTYPVVVLCFSVLVTVLLLIWVIPVFQQAFIKVGIKLPFLTQTIVNISMVVRSWYFWGLVAILGVVGFIVGRRFYSSPSGRLTIDSLKLRLPVVGPIIYAASLARLVRSFSLLISAGLPMTQSLEVIRGTALNAKMSRALANAKRMIVEGSPLAAALDKTKVFPSFLIEMVAVGEESGTLSEMLERLAVHFEEEFDFKLNRFLTLLEPLLIIFLGGMVAFILLSIYLPILSLWEGLTHLR